MDWYDSECWEQSTNILTLRWTLYLLYWNTQQRNTNNTCDFVWLWRIYYTKCLYVIERLSKNCSCHAHFVYAGQLWWLLTLRCKHELCFWLHISFGNRLHLRAFFFRWYNDVFFPLLSFPLLRRLRMKEYLTIIFENRSSDHIIQSNIKTIIPTN